MKSEESVFVKSLRYQLVTMKILGVYPFENWSRISFLLYGNIFYLLFTVPIPVLSVTKLSVTHEVNLKKILDTVFLTSQLGITILKYLPFKISPYTIRRTIFHHLNSQIFNDYDAHQENNIVSPSIDVSTKVHRGFFIACAAALISWSFTPLFIGQKVLPMDLWLPFDIYASDQVFYTIYISMFIGVGIGAFTNSAVDTLVVSFLLYATAQVKILKSNLENLANNAERSFQTTYGHLNFSVSEKEMLRNRLVYSNIHKCVEHHIAIKELSNRFVKDVEKTYSFVLFTQFCASIVVICTSCLQFTYVKLFSASFYTMVIFITTMLSEVLMFCYFGTLLYDESSTIIQSIYIGQWIELDTKAKKALLTLMENSKSPMCVTAGNLLILSLDTFVMILKRSYSLLAALNTFK